MKVNRRICLVVSVVLVSMLCACTKSIRASSIAHQSYLGIVVDGAVVNPGVHVVGNRGVVNALVVAGGLAKEASTRVQLRGKRDIDSSEYDLIFAFELFDIIYGGKGDIWVPNGWKVVVVNPFVGRAPVSVNKVLVDFVQQQRSDPKFDMRLVRFTNGEIPYEDVEK